MQTHTHKESDRLLRDAVIRQLEWDPQVVSKDISVTVTDNVVALTGFTHSYSEKYATEKAVKSVYGVQAVANDIEVKPAAMRTDPEIARDIVNAMKLDLTVPDDRIKTGVHDGYVTLEGTVDWNFQRAGAEACARNVHGVRGVLNHIAIKPKVSAIEVTHNIEEALRRSAEVDARRITVSARDGEVVLDGSVRSWFEREEAERAAWAAPGVSEVIDHIAVVP
jgi:osmotically-inducible protein OsmY